MADMMAKKNYDLTEITRLLLAMRDSHIPRSGASYDTLNAAIDLINNPSLLTKWISVKDRYPEDQQHVLIAYKYSDYVSIGYFDEGFAEWDSLYDNEIVRPDYWMPLPEPPKEV